MNNFPYESQINGVKIRSFHPITPAVEARALKLARDSGWDPPKTVPSDGVAISEHLAQCEWRSRSAPDTLSEESDTCYERHEGRAPG